MNGGRGYSIRADDGWIFLQVLNLHIWRRNDQFLKFGFIPLLSIEDENVPQQKDRSISLTKSLTPIFGVIMIGFGHYFFFMDRHLN
jgi:hypothetical protein